VKGWARNKEAANYLMFTVQFNNTAATTTAPFTMEFTVGAYQWGDYDFTAPSQPAAPTAADLYSSRAAWQQAITFLGLSLISIGYYI